MANVIMMMAAYALGMFVSFLLFNPAKEWEEGYNKAKEFYGDWSKGFDDGWNSAKILFQDYEQGFGEGFESGWNTALEEKEEEG